MIGMATHATPARARMGLMKFTPRGSRDVRVRGYPLLLLFMRALRRATKAASAGPSQSWVLMSW